MPDEGGDPDSETQSPTGADEDDGDSACDPMAGDAVGRTMEAAIDAPATGSRRVLDAGLTTLDAARDSAAKAARTASSAAQGVASGTRAAARVAQRHSVGAATVVQALLAGPLASHLNRLVAAATSGPATVYDKAMDAKYLDPLLRPDLGGSYHRLFDGGHTVIGAASAARAAAPDDTLIQQTTGTVSALLRDASTPRGLPLATWDKATFDSVAQRLEAVAGIPKGWLYELSTFDVADMLGATLGVAAVALNWNRADTEEFAQLVAGMGLSAAVSLNPLLLLVVVVAAAQAFSKARLNAEYTGLVDGAFRGAAASGAALGAIGLVTVAGGSAGAGLLAGIVVGVLAHKAAAKVSVTEIAGLVSRRAGALSKSLIDWASEIVGRGGEAAEVADVAIAREILALPRVSGALDVRALLPGEESAKVRPSEAVSADPPLPPSTFGLATA